MNESRPTTVLPRLRLLLGLLATAPACATTPAPTPATTPAPERAEKILDPTPADADARAALRTPWGLAASEVKAQHPAVVALDGGLMRPTEWPQDGGPALTGVLIFGLADDDRLAQISVSFGQAYPSMDACAADWRTLRKQLDEDYGKSASDNLAAYWSSGDRDVELACNPTNSSAILSVVVRPRAPE